MMTPPNPLNSLPPRKSAPGGPSAQSSLVVVASPVATADATASPVVTAQVVTAQAVPASPVVTAQVVTAQAVPASPVVTAQVVTAQAVPGSVLQAEAVTGEFAAPGEPPALLPPLEVMSGAAATVPSLSSGKARRSSLVAPVAMAKPVVAQPVVMGHAVTGELFSDGLAALSSGGAAPVLENDHPAKQDTTSDALVAAASPARDDGYHRESRATPPGGRRGASPSGGVPLGWVAVLVVFTGAAALGMGYVMFAGGGKPAMTGGEPRRDEPTKTPSGLLTGPSWSSTASGSQGVSTGGSAAPFSSYNDDGTRKDAKAIGQQKRRSEVLNTLRDAEGALAAGQFREALSLYGELLVAGVDDVPEAPSARELQNKFGQALRGLEDKARREERGKRGPNDKTGTVKADPDSRGGGPPKVGTATPAVVQPTEAEIAEAAKLVAKGDAAAAAGDHHGACAAYIDAAVRYPAAFPANLPNKFSRSLGKLSNTLVKLTGNESPDQRKAKSDELRRLAEAQEDTQPLKVVCETYAALILTGFYTSRDLKKFTELRSKLERIEGRTIFD